MQTFSCSLDETAKITPWFIAGLGVLIFAASIFAYIKSANDTSVLILALLPVLLLVSIVIAMYYFKTQSITVNASGITIERKISPVTIAFSDITSIRMVDKQEMKGVIRTFGNGGVFGYTGQYYNRKLGSMTWYCTQRKNYILIEKKDKKRAVVTPDNPDQLLQALRSADPAIVIPAAQTSL